MKLFVLLMITLMGSCEKGVQEPAPISVTSNVPEGAEIAYFASGCFWCVEGALEQVKGVNDVVSGYAGGNYSNPTYTNHGNHTEAVKVIYFPNVVSYEQLLSAFETLNDFTTVGQHPDYGQSYRSAIFPKDGEQATLVSELLSKYDDHTVQVTSFDDANFTQAEDYHQNYFKRLISGRSVVNRSYGMNYTAPRVSEFRENVQQLFLSGGVPLYTREQFGILFLNRTEIPHTDPNLDEDRDGIYVSIVSGKEIFQSHHRFHSGSGWLSFSAVDNPDDFDHPWDRGAAEIREKLTDTHLGHIILDSRNKAPNGRWCINGKVTEFIPN